MSRSRRAFVVGAALVTAACAPSERPSAEVASAGRANELRPEAVQRAEPHVLPAGQLPSPEVVEKFLLEVQAGCDLNRDGLACLWGDTPAPAAMMMVSLSAVPVALREDRGLDAYGLVLSGEATLRDVATGEQHLLGPWQAFHAPGAGVGLAASGGARVVLAVATDGELLSERGQPASVTARMWSKRPGELRRWSFRERQHLSWAGGKAHARLGVEEGRASFGLLWASAATPVPPHRHARSWEVIALLSAQGQFMRAADDQSEKLAPQAVSSGALVAVPANVRHAWQPDGARPLFAVQMYLPPGPEQRFKKLAGAGPKAP